jgi:putative membrane protein
MNKTLLVMCCSAAMLSCGVLFAQSYPVTQGEAKPQATLHAQPDADFIRNASAAGIGEVEAGKLAQGQGQSAVVKLFGKTMVRDHTQANIALEKIADKKGIVVADGPAADQKAAIDSLKALSVRRIR